MVEKWYLDHFKHLPQLLLDLWCKVWCRSTRKTVYYVWRMLIIFIKLKRFQYAFNLGWCNFRHICDSLFINFHQNSIVDFCRYFSTFLSLYLTYPVILLLLIKATDYTLRRYAPQPCSLWRFPFKGFPADCPSFSHFYTLVVNTY